MIRDIANRELRLFSDPGRCCRPIFIVEDQKLLIRKQHIMKLRHKEESGFRWSELIANGLIEYIDCEETENAMIAMFPDKLVLPEPYSRT